MGTRCEAVVICAHVLFGRSSQYLLSHRNSGAPSRNLVSWVGGFTLTRPFALEVLVRGGRMSQVLNSRWWYSPAKVHQLRA